MANEQQLIVQWQSYFDEALREVGVRAPPSTLGQTPNDYVRETCRDLKRRYLPQNNEYYQVNYRGLRADALSTFVPQLVNEVKKQVRNPDNLAPGEIRRIDVLGPDGQKWIDWVGIEIFCTSNGTSWSTRDWLSNATRSRDDQKLISEVRAQGSQFPSRIECWDYQRLSETSASLSTHPRSQDFAQPQPGIGPPSSVLNEVYRNGREGMKS